MAHPRLQVMNMPNAEEGERRNQAPGALHKAVYTSNPCAFCAGYCCAARVILSTVEAQRLALTLALPLKDIVDAVVFIAADATQVDPPPIPLADGDHVLQLARSLETQSCKFMMKVNGQGRCGVYALRPHVCALYPYQMEIDGERLNVGSQKRCPVGWMTTDGVEDRLMERYQLLMEDHAQERKLLDAWAVHSGTDRSWRAYAAFSQAWTVETLGFPAPPTLPTGRKRLGQAMW